MEAALLRGLDRLLELRDQGLARGDIQLDGDPGTRVDAGIDEVQQQRVLVLEVRRVVVADVRLGQGEPARSRWSPLIWIASNWRAAMNCSPSRAG